MLTISSSDNRYMYGSSVPARTNAPVQTTAPSFVGESSKYIDNDKNPISRAGETMNLLKATFLGGLVLGARLLFELFDGDFLFETAGKGANRLINGAGGSAKSTSQFLRTCGGAVGLIVAGISGFAILYTMLNAPKIAYESKINTVRKRQETDVYIQANKAEKEIYNEINKRAENADEDEKQKLRENYQTMRLAKNNVPDFLK